jgi:hypothetical protein
VTHTRTQVGIVGAGAYRSRLSQWRPAELTCDVIAARDGSQTVARAFSPLGERTDHFREYPYGWFWHSDDGGRVVRRAHPCSARTRLALISTRSPDAIEFDLRRQEAELELVIVRTPGRRCWPKTTSDWLT